MLAFTDEYFITSDIYSTNCYHCWNTKCLQTLQICRLLLCSHVCYDWSFYKYAGYFLWPFGYDYFSLPAEQWVPPENPQFDSLAEFVVQNGLTLTRDHNDVTFLSSSALILFSFFRFFSFHLIIIGNYCSHWRGVDIMEIYRKKAL
jgi:hypothetical protein